MKKMPEDRNPIEKPSAMKYLLLILIMIVIGLIAIMVIMNSPRKESGKESAPAAAAETQQNVLSGDAQKEAAAETEAEQAQAPETQTETILQTEPETEPETEDPALAFENHSYEYVISDCTWSEAQNRAREKGGYLVNINSPEEFARISKEISSQGYNKIQFRLGGRRDLDGRQYYWVDADDRFVGEPLNESSSWCYDEWLDGEPNYEYDNVKEYTIDMYKKDESYWVLNDVPNDIVSIVPYYSGKLGYIIEYDHK